MDTVAAVILVPNSQGTGERSSGANHDGTKTSTPDTLNASCRDQMADNFRKPVDQRARDDSAEPGDLSAQAGNPASNSEGHDDVRESEGAQGRSEVKIQTAEETEFQQPSSALSDSALSPISSFHDSEPETQPSALVLNQPADSKPGTHVAVNDVDNPAEASPTAENKSKSPDRDGRPEFGNGVAEQANSDLVIMWNDGEPGLALEECDLPPMTDEETISLPASAENKLTRLVAILDRFEEITDQPDFSNKISVIWHDNEPSGGLDASGLSVDWHTTVRDGKAMIALPEPAKAKLFCMLAILDGYERIADGIERVDTLYNTTKRRLQNSEHAVDIATQTQPPRRKIDVALPPQNLRDLAERPASARGDDEAQCD